MDLNLEEVKLLETELAPVYDKAIRASYLNRSETNLKKLCLLNSISQKLAERKLNESILRGTARNSGRLVLAP